MQPACARFRVHLAKDLPPIELDNNSIKSKPIPLELEKAVEVWKEKIEFLQDESERMRWLECIRQFIFLDTDRNGLPDWTAIVDGRPSRTLFPLDPDIDGDGLPNLVDPDPYRNIDDSPRGFVPAHLRMAGEKGRWQKKLLLDLGVLAIDHTDEHLVDTLAATYSTLRLDSVRNWKKEVRGFNVLYAFGHRGLNSEAAAYHPTAHAISIPGKRGLGINRLSKIQKCKFVSSILHELGHALLFEIVTADELREKAIQLGRWNLPTLSDGDIWSTIFFGPTNGPQEEFVSEYAQTNVHEWFAESFAAYIWQKELLDSHSCQAFKAQHLSNQLKQWLDILLIRARPKIAQKVSQKVP